MRNLKFVVEYNGGDFFGWQKQNGKRTVQGELEHAFFELCKEEVEFAGSGRTDRGVHALGQVASVRCCCPIPLKNIKQALNNLLPSDIRILKVENSKEDFHARFSAKRKTYVYVVQTGGQRSAIDFKTIGFYPYEVDFEKMKCVARDLVGKHNFRAFASSDTNVQNFEREIYAVKLSKCGRKIKFEITGNGFLYNMVRIIAGTLISVGRGFYEPERIRDILEARERTADGVTAPPNGLVLVGIDYGEPDLF